MLGEAVSTSPGALALLSLGLVFGLRHATEVDHVVAVSAIVSEHRSLWRSALVGGLWGVGHTASLVAVGVVVLALRVAIPGRVSGWLEFGVALMIIALGASALVRALRRRTGVHIHRHTHDGLSHVHIHFHERANGHTAVGATRPHATADEKRADADASDSDATASHPHATAPHAHSAAPHTHAVSRVGVKPLLVGAMHGLAGSAALTLVVLTQVGSVALGLLYLAVFGLGSVFGMLLMSGLVGLPFALTSRRLSRIHSGLQTFAGALGVVFGLWYAYETCVAGGLWRTAL